MAKAAGKAKDLFTASEVARFCQVDLKTIHNWAERDEIRHFRTPGRHLRFRRADVLDFLRKYGYPVPAVLMQGKPRIVIVSDDAAELQHIKRSLSREFEVHTFDDPVEALLHMGAHAPDALVIADQVGELDALRLISPLRKAEPTRHTRVVLYSDDEDGKRKALEAGAFAHVAKHDAHRLRETLESLMGVERS